MAAWIKGRLAGEEGATLIELLMGIVLTGIILAALAGGVIAYMHGANATTYLLNETPELQLLSTTFGTDVQSSETVSASATPACGSGTAIVQFAWNDYTSTTASVPVRVSYTYSAGDHELRRFACRNGAVEENTKIVTHIQPSQTPQVQCDGTACGAGSPKRVDLALLICTANASGTCLDSPMPANFTGIRRLS